MPIVRSRIQKLDCEAAFAAQRPELRLDSPGPKARLCEHWLPGPRAPRTPGPGRGDLRLHALCLCVSLSLCSCAAEGLPNMLQSPCQATNSAIEAAEHVKHPCI